jgi:hypothetical protein
MEKIDGTSGFLYRPDVTSREKKQEKSGKSQKSSFNGVLGKLFSRPAEGGELGPLMKYTVMRNCGDSSKIFRTSAKR